MSRVPAFIKITLLTLVLINLALVIYIWWRPQHLHRAHPKLWESEMHWKPGQEAKFEKLREEHRLAMTQLQEENSSIHDSLFSHIAFPVSGAEKWLQASARVRYQMDSVTFVHFQDIRNILDEDQYDLFDRLIRKALPGGPPPPGKHPE